MSKEKKEIIKSEIGHLLHKNGWTGSYAGTIWVRKDEAIQIAISDTVVHLYDFKRNKNGIKAATLMLKDIVVLEDGFRTEFVQIKI